MVWSTEIPDSIILDKDNWILDRGIHYYGIDEETTLQDYVSGVPVIDAYPNPFCDKISIVLRAESKEASTSSAIPFFSCLSIYDATGRLVRKWDCPTTKLSNHIIWDCTDGKSVHVPAGVYFIHYTTEQKTLIEKAILIR